MTFLIVSSYLENETINNNPAHDLCYHFNWIFYYDLVCPDIITMILDYLYYRLIMFYINLIFSNFNFHELEI